MQSKKTDTEQLDKKEGRDEKGRFTKGVKPVAGFDRHPENRNPGGWRKENSISYQYNRFKNMTPSEIEKWLKDWEKPESKKDKVNYSAAAWIAYRRVRQSMEENGLPDAKEVADRTEGKSVQLIRHEVGDIEDARERLGRILGDVE